VSAKLLWVERGANKPCRAKSNYKALRQALVNCGYYLSRTHFPPIAPVLAGSPNIGGQIVPASPSVVGAASSMGGPRPVRVDNATGLFQIGGAHWVDSARPSGFSSFRRASIGAIVALNSSVTPRPVTAESVSGGARFAPCAIAGPCERIARFRRSNERFLQQPVQWAPRAGQGRG
jgi:hypothetical protein